MKKLFLIDGAAGFSKSDLIKCIEHQEAVRSAVVVHKNTTRKTRKHEEAKFSDLIFDSGKNYEKQKNDSYYYKYEGEEYWFEKTSFKKAIKKHENVFIIIRERVLTRKIFEEYKNRIVVVPVFIYSDKELVKKRLEEEFKTISKEDRNELIVSRINRLESTWRDFLAHPDSRVRFINNCEQGSFNQQINDLIGSYSPDKIVSIFNQKYKQITHPFFIFIVFMIFFVLFAFTRYFGQFNMDDRWIKISDDLWKLLTYLVTVIITSVFTKFIEKIK